MQTNELNVNANGGTELLERRLRSHLSADLLDQSQIVSSRARELEQSKKRVFWAHDLANDPEAFQALGEERWKRFHLIVFVSHWQQSMYNAYLGVPYGAGIVIENNIECIDYHNKPADKVRLMYYSTPHRGLDVLEAVFSHITKNGANSDLELNVFSSFDLYGWGERDKQFEALFERLDNHPQVNYSKSVSNDRIREELQRSHVFTYPSTWTETSCLCLIEAMCAGLACVHSSLGALPETCMGETYMYDYTEDKNEHARRFMGQLDEALWSVRNGISFDNMSQNANFKYNMWGAIVKWEKALKNLLTT